VAVPKNIDSLAIRILEDNGWLWDDYRFSFRRVRFEESTQDYLSRPPLLITYEEISDHGLTSSSVAQVERAREWLKQRINELAPSKQASTQP